MKKSILCSSVALACALGLSACGGNNGGQLPLTVYLSGVTTTGLTISNKGAAAVPVPAGTAFTFTDLVPYDSDYDIKIVTEPANVEKDSCKLLNGKGNTGSFSPNNIAIACVVKTYDLGGTVTGLTMDDLVVNNGAQSVTIKKGATTFTMSAPTEALPKYGQVAEGIPYGLTILTQPKGGKCTIANPAGIMPAAAVTSIAISCS